MKEYLELQIKQIDSIVNKVRTNLTRNERFKFKTICTIDVHNKVFDQIFILRSRNFIFEILKDIIEGFVRDSILEPNEFEWVSQLRFYWMKHVDNLEVIQCSGAVLQ